MTTTAQQQVRVTATARCSSTAGRQQQHVAGQQGSRPWYRDQTAAWTAQAQGSAHRAGPLVAATCLARQPMGTQTAEVMCWETNRKHG
jgi:hypothetical protein